MAKPTLTTVILTHGRTKEVERLAADALKHSDEVLLIDNYSDAMIEKRHHLKIVRHALKGDFSQQRNFALTQVDTDWTFFIDSDEWCPASLWTEIHSIIDQDRADAIVFRRLDWFQGRRLRHGEVGGIRLLRCAKTNLGTGKWVRPVHEIWNVPTDRLTEAATPIEHRPHPTLREFLAKLNEYAVLEPQSRSRYPFWRVVFELLVYPMAKFGQNYFLRLGFLDGWPGLVHAAGMSYYSLITRVFLYEARHTQRP
jgi:hypothetical protein